MTANTTYGPKVTVTRSCSDCPACETEQYREQGDSGTDWTCAHPSLEKPRYIGIFSTTPDWCPAASPSAQPSGAPEVQPDWLLTRLHRIYELADTASKGPALDSATKDILSRILTHSSYLIPATAPTPSGAPADTTKALRELVALEADGKHADESAIEVWERARAALAGAPAVQEGGANHG